MGLLIIVSETYLDIFNIGSFQVSPVLHFPRGQGREKKMKTLFLFDLSINVRFEHCKIWEMEVVSEYIRYNYLQIINY